MNKFFSHLSKWGCFVMLLSISINLQAQELNYGLKLGTNINQFRSPHAQWVSKQWTPRPVVGMYLQSHHETTGFFLQQEILLSQKTGRLTFITNNTEQNSGSLQTPSQGQQIQRTIQFIEVPLIFGKEIFDQRAAIYVGTMISYPIFAQQKGGLPGDDIRYNTQTINTLLVYQFGVQLKIRKKMRLDIRYERNLWNVGFVLPSGQRIDDQMHNIQIVLQWDLFSEREDIFRF